MEGKATAFKSFTFTTARWVLPAQFNFSCQKFEDGELRRMRMLVCK